MHKLQNKKNGSARENNKENDRNSLKSILFCYGKLAYFVTILFIYLLFSLIKCSHSFFNFLALGQEIKEINTQIGYILTYDNQGGTGCTYKTQTKDKPWGELCIPTKEGYHFEGWYTEPDGGGTKVTSTTTATNNLTVYASYYQKTLYDVLRLATNEGTYAREYIGNHQDSMDASLSNKKIYHWYATTPENGTAILDKNNVIFANHCWQMIRTTDTGGVRLIYNGEVVDGKCLNTRGTHVGYGGNRSSQSLNGTYWYGTDYTYSNGRFSLSGTTSSVQVTSSNGSTVIPTLVGKYTCKSTSENGTCSTLYLIESQYSSYGAYVIPLNSNSNYSQFGTLQFNVSNNSLAYVGYMNNIIYLHEISFSNYSISLSNFNITSGYYYYSDTVTYDSATNKYKLTDPDTTPTLSDYNVLIGKYISSDFNPTSTVYYVSGVNGPNAWTRELSNGDLATSMMIGDSYTDNGNGTYTVNNATLVTYIDWYNSTSSTLDTYKGKYACAGTSATCSNLMHISPSITPSTSSFYYFGTEHSYKYSESVSYSNGTYTLTGDIKTIWDIYDSTELAKINTHHYTCLSDANTCSTVRYVHYQSASTIYYISLTDVSNVETALNNMLTANNVNAKNSVIKTGIDAWYKKYLLPYDSYIEDTIYCNDRGIEALGSFKPDGGSVTGLNSYLKFKEYTIGSDLSCINITDKFSVSNSSAQLTYKVGLVSSPEMNLLNQNNARKTGQVYWSLSPFSYSNAVNNRNVLASGSFSFSGAGQAYGVRPTISLIPGIGYSSGDGSMANPYVVDID